MAGYRVELKVLNKLAEDVFPGLFRTHGEVFSNSLDQLGPKWFICICIDTMPLKPTLMILESFFYHGDHTGVIPAIFGIVQKAKPAIDAGEDLVVALMQSTADCTESDMLDALTNPGFEVDQFKARRIREKAKLELRRETNDNALEVRAL